MNENVAISVSNLSKKYFIGREKESSLRGALSSLFKSSNFKNDEFWALKNINFDILKGDVVGIVGKNGAGKSTLLKILSRITKPTEGTIEINGRVASLLEVGTGFHPELTGRENIFLNGTILGMTRKEVKDKFDEIISFSGVEKFIDTPVKHYSSGMYVRLAFSVAAHLEPEILIIDEVLAVGDIEFQKKCLGKMEDVSKHGRTVLFVSHNIGAIAQLCNKCIFLKNGAFVSMDKTDKVINQYLNQLENSTINFDRRNDDTWKDKNHIFAFEMTDSNFAIKQEFKHDEDILIKFSLHLPNFNDIQQIALSLYEKNKIRIFTIHEPILKFFDQQKKQADFIIKIPKNTITPGLYSWIFCILDKNNIAQDVQDDVCQFEIIDNGSNFTSFSPGTYGAVFVNYEINNKVYYEKNC